MELYAIQNNINYTELNAPEKSESQESSKPNGVPNSVSNSVIMKKNELYKNFGIEITKLDKTLKK